MNIKFRQEIKGDPNSMNLYTVIHLNEVTVWRADDYAHLMAQLTRAGIEINDTVLKELGKVLSN